MPQPDLTSMLRRARRRPIFDVTELSPTDLGRAVLEELLPHRGSMLLVDRIIGVDAGARRIAGRRTIQADDPVFEGHFPGDPMYPGVLQVEAVGQLGLCLRAFPDRGAIPVDQPPAAGRTPPGDGPRPPGVRLLRVHEAHFMAPVRPGADALMLAEVVDDVGYTFTTLAQMLVDGTPTSVCAFEAMLLDDDD